MYVNIVLQLLGSSNLEPILISTLEVFFVDISYVSTSPSYFFMIPIPLILVLMALEHAFSLL